MVRGEDGQQVPGDSRVAGAVEGERDLGAGARAVGEHAGRPRGTGAAVVECAGADVGVGVAASGVVAEAGRLPVAPVDARRGVVPAARVAEPDPRVQPATTEAAAAAASPSTVRRLTVMPASCRVVAETGRPAAGPSGRLRRGLRKSPALHPAYITASAP